MRRAALLAVVAVVIVVVGALATSRPVASDARLRGAFRRPAQQGWTYVRLEGTPSEVGFQNGYLLAQEILDVYKVFSLELTHYHNKDWTFFRDAARTVHWPHIEREYREELQGIADGLKAQGVALDLWDVVAMNAALEWSYYVAEYNKKHDAGPSTPSAAEHCSAFVATGSYTKDGRVVMAHNNWTGYLDGARWTVVFDITPAGGHRLVMDSLPGFIHSADDFGVNSAGIAITETTISGFHGYDVNGIPEFVRARKALQYSPSIDDVARIFKDGNNGGYANDWLIADTRKNEIASLELGLKNVTLERKTDGYFVGSNIPINLKLAAEETNFDLTDMGLSGNARHRRWEQLMAANKGRIGLAEAQAFMADHVDTYAGKTDPSDRTLCGHIDLSPRGSGTWMPPYGIGGAVQNKAADAALLGQMSFTAAAGHACGIDFVAASHLAKHPEFSWQKPLLRDMKSMPWTTIRAQ
jgi:Phospholipase B